MPIRFFVIVFLFAYLTIYSASYATDTSALPPAGPQASLPTSLINEIASEDENGDFSASGVFGQILNRTDNAAPPNETYQGLQKFWYNDFFGSFFNAVIQTIKQLIYKFRYDIVPNTISGLCKMVKNFFLNIDLTKRQNQVQDSNSFTFMLNQLNNTMHGIALDISLLLFILSIWRYWVDAAWKGSGNLMSPVGRLIFAIGMLIAWPTIYHFQIQLSNEMINTLFADTTGGIQFFDQAMSALFGMSNFPAAHSLALADTQSITLLAATTAGTSTEAFLPSLIIIVICFLAIILIYQLFYIIILKAIQTALLTAQYVFAPVFLVLLTNPVTDNIATSFIRTFVEVSLWNFIWIGLLKILVILLLSDFNPWGKLLTAIGVLQIMMDVPQFLAHAKISVASDFVSPRFFAKAAKEITGYDKKLSSGIEFLTNWFNGKKDKEGLKTNPDHDNLPLNSLSSDTTYGGYGTGLPNKSPGQHEKENAIQPQRKSPSSGLSGSLAAAAGLSQSATMAMSGSSGGTAFAAAAANSTAIALAVASINNSFGVPPGKANGSKPKRPSPTPGSDPYPKIPFNPGPSIGPSPNSDPHKIPPFDPLLLPPGGHYPLPLPNSILSLALSSSGILLTDKIIKFQQSSENSMANDRSFQDNQKAPSYQQDNLNRKISSKEEEKLPPLWSQPNSTGLTIDQAASNNIFTGAPALIFNQLYAFHTGAFNCYKKKRQSNAPHYFPPFHKDFAFPNLQSGSYFNDLIFVHGNIPTLMGIPPIYPGPGRI